MRYLKYSDIDLVPNYSELYSRVDADPSVNFLGKKFMGTVRSTVAIDKGKILKIWSNVRVKGHAQEVLDFIKSSK